MLKLLLSQNRHELRTEYISRLLNVYFIIIMIMSGVMIALLYIPHLFVQVQDTIISNELANSKIVDGSKQRAEFEKLSRHVQFEYDLFTAPVMHPFDIISELINISSDGITITAINVLKTIEDENTGNIIFDLTINGQARDRNALVTYTKAIESNDTFEQVTVPPTNFTKESDIVFSITLTTTPTETKI